MIQWWHGQDLAFHAILFVLNSSNLKDIMAVLIIFALNALSVRIICQTISKGKFYEQRNMVTLYVLTEQLHPSTSF